MNPFEYTALYKVLSDVTAERLSQEEKWGQQNHNDFEWLTILGEEVGEACQAALKAAPHMKEHSHLASIQLRAELVQVAAVAIAHIEAIDRRA